MCVFYSGVCKGGEAGGRRHGLPSSIGRRGIVQSGDFFFYIQPGKNYTTATGTSSFLTNTHKQSRVLSIIRLRSYLITVLIYSLNIFQNASFNVYNCFFIWWLITCNILVEVGFNEPNNTPFLLLPSPLTPLIKGSALAKISPIG